jgi:hypothetical protein
VAGSGPEEPVQCEPVTAWQGRPGFTQGDVGFRSTHANGKVYAIVEICEAKLPVFSRFGELRRRSASIFGGKASEPANATVVLLLHSKPGKFFMNRNKARREALPSNSA